MPRLSKIVEMDEDTVNHLASSYYDMARPPEIFLKLPKMVLKAAWKQSGGNWRRCSVSLEDGISSIVVHNVPVW
jgi:hypothetical protein